MLSKAAIVLIASGVTGSGFVAHTHFANGPERTASTLEVAAPSEANTASADLSNESFQQAYIQAGLAAQRQPFACFARVAR